MNSTGLWTILACALATASFACDKLIPSDSKPAASATKSAPQALTEEQKDEQLAGKLHPYIECLNELTPEVRESRNWYLRNIDPEKGPTGKETFGGIKAIRPEQLCFDGLDKAKAAQGTLSELDGAVAAYRKAATDLKPLIQSADEYLTQQNFKDDKWAKGKEMHPGLMAAFKTFFESSSELSDKVRAINERLNERHLERLSKDPKRKLEYLTSKALAEAKTLVRLGDVEKLEDLNADAYSKAVEAFAAALKSVSSYRESHMAEAVNHANFLGYGEQFLLAAKEVGRAKRDGKPMPASLSTPGHPAYALEKYNAFIGVANDLEYKN